MSASSPFNPATSQAHAITHLFIITLAIAVVILALVTGLVLYVIVRYRARPEAGEPYQEFGQPKLEMVWTIAPALILIFLFGYAFHTMREADPKDPPDTPDLTLVGHQWWWEARYKSGVIAANEIHLPAGTRLLARLESADVIHDWWVPQLGRKMDMTPGHPTTMWLQAGKPGVYLGACAEYCGAGHAWMRIRVDVQTPTDFAAWQQQQLRSAVAPAGGEAAQGAKLFKQETCVNCHAIAGAHAKGRIGPDLTHIGSRQTLAAGVMPNTPQNLQNWLANPQAFKPGSYMPDFHLSTPDAHALAVYLETLK